MGLFSTKKKRFVETTVTRAVDDTMIPNILQIAIIEAILKNQDIPATIQDKILHGNFRRFDRMYRFAERGDYYYGLPNERILTNSDGYDIAKAEIESVAGEEVNIEYLYFSPLNNVHAGWLTLVEEHDYDASSNTIGDLTLALGRQVYLDKMVAVHASGEGLEPEQSALGTWGESTASGETPERPALTEDSPLRAMVLDQEIRIGEGETESVEIHYIYQDENNDLQRDFFVIDLSEYSTTQEYYQAKYKVDGESFYWLYDPQTGSNTELNAVYDIPDIVASGNYFPFVVFRGAKENRTAEEFHETEAYETTVELLDILGMDFQEMGDSIHESPDIDDVEQAVMMMGVPITSEHETEIEYLWEYFSNLQTQLPQLQAPTSLREIFDLSGNEALYAVEITDADFSMLLTFNSITRKFKAGSIGPVGTVTNTYFLIAGGDDLAHIPGAELAGDAKQVTARFFKKQITEGVYEEIRVGNPNIRYHIADDRGVTGDGDDDRLLVPIDREIARKIPTLRRSDLYFRSLHFVFNSYIVTKTKWYESFLFQAGLIVFAVVVAVLSYGSAYEAIGVAMAAGGYQAAAIALAEIVITTIVKSVLFKIIFTELVKIIGLDAAFALAAIIAIAGGLKAMQQGKLVAGSTAAKLLQVAGGIVTAIDARLTDLMDEFLDEMAEFNQMVETAWEELEETQKLLGDTLGLDPLTFLNQQPLVIFGESPTEFYNRVSHTGNPGVHSLNIVQNFVDISLRLPEIEQTLGDQSYAE